MNILIVANEFPYPANHGGKVDILNRILAFKNAGHRVFLITWQGIKKGNVPTDDEKRFLEQYVDKLIVLDILRNWIRFVSLLIYPSLVAARFISEKKYKEILNESKAFSPDFIFIDNIYGALIGQKLKEDLKLPIGVRLHNIESSYMKGQYLLSKGLKTRLSILGACLHLKSFEKGVISKSDAFFDISIDDLKYWTNKGFNHGHWLPPILSKSDLHIKPTKFDYNVGFLGNLNTPNNVEGIKWFVNSVLPLLLVKYPSLRILILGSEPSDEVIALCNCQKSIELIPNPANPNIYLDRVNVLINPVKFGSGVNIKSVEMLMRDNEVVCTSVGIKGLPKEILDVFFIADTPEEFSQYILDIVLYDHKKSMQLRCELREMFKEKSIQKVINVMNSLIH
ncbi:hypothetical protein ACM55F_11135 [Flavobacterium sp. XS2P12]|uniref:hypothetical protein n=1 Tax=Flavobacterium melibiosi TaxID=3398734 RepID=UPI003A8B9A92